MRGLQGLEARKLDQSRLRVGAVWDCFLLFTGAVIRISNVTIKLLFKFLFSTGKAAVPILLGYEF